MTLPYDADVPYDSPLWTFDSLPIRSAATTGILPWLSRRAMSEPDRSRRPLSAPGVR